MGDTLRTLPAPVRERGGSLFLKNINVFICIITSLGHPVGRPMGHRAGKGRGCQGTSLSEAEESSAWRVGEASQGSVLGLVSGQHSAVVGQLLAHGHHLLPQQGVLLLQEGRPHRYLVLLEPPGVAGPLGCLVILVPSAPVFFVLGGQESTDVQRSPTPATEGRNSFACAFWDQTRAKRAPTTLGGCFSPSSGAERILGLQWMDGYPRVWLPRALVAKESGPMATVKAGDSLLP